MVPNSWLHRSHSKLYCQGVKFASHLRGATSWGPSIISLLYSGFPLMLPHPACSGDDTLYPAHFTAVSVDKQNLGHPVKCFNMCSVCLFTCKCVTSCTCSRAFYLLIKHCEKMTNCSEPKLQQPEAKHYWWFFFLKYHLINLADFPQLTDSFWITWEVFWAKSSLFTEV